MIAFQNDMLIPIYSFLNQKFNYTLNNNKFRITHNKPFNFSKVNNKEFPIYKFFNNLPKSEPANIIKFNVANEFAVKLFKNKMIKYTDICYLVAKISSLNLNYKLNTIKDVIYYHELLEIKINEKFKTL